MIYTLYLFDITSEFLKILSSNFFHLKKVFEIFEILFFSNFEMNKKYLLILTIKRANFKVICYIPQNHFFFFFLTIPIGDIKNDYFLSPHYDIHT